MSRNFEYFDVWMTLLPGPPIWSPQQMVAALHEQGLEVKINKQAAEPGLPWAKVRFGIDQSTVDCLLYSAQEPAVRLFLDSMLQPQTNGDSLPSEVVRLLEEIQFVAQTIKTAGDFETAAELEYGLNCCLAYRETTSQPPALWFMQNGPQLAFCDTANADPGEILWQADSEAYRQAVRANLD